jgi:hypothetical protein
VFALSRLNWDKARERDRTRDAKQTAAHDQGGARRSAARQAALAAFVAEHEIACFKCGAEKADWAKTGISTRGPWAICANCASQQD